jgi:hypothetical protein
MGRCCFGGRPGTRLRGSDFAFGHRQKPVALRLLAGQFMRAANGFGPLAGALFRGLLVSAALLHFAKDALALHLLLQRTKRLLDIVVANQNLHAFSDLGKEEWGP